MNNFEVLTYNKLLGFADGNIIRWFPRLNLLAISMNKMSIWVYRLNGERVYSINNKSPIKAISFLKNGDYFCLSGVDNLIKIYDSNTGKLIKILHETFDDIKLISWSYHSENLITDHSLFNINILKNIPKITCNNSEISTSNQQDIEEINNDILSYLIVLDSKKFSINFNNLLTVTDIKLPHENINFLEHFENSNFLDQCFLIENGNDLELIKLNFKGFTDPDEINYLISIILDLCKIISIMNYLKEQISLLSTEIKPFLELLDRYLSNLKDSLIGNENNEQIDNNTILETFYDMALTNIIPENLKDYWLNQFGERGVKRVSKTGNTMYDLLRKNIFTKIIAGLERLIIILNKLKGLNKWFNDSDKTNKFGLNVDSIDKTIETSKLLMKKFHHFIWIINEEQKFFNIFINWVKAEIIEKLSKEDDIETYINSQISESFKISDLMKYFEEHLLTSNLTKYFAVEFNNPDILEIKEPREDIAGFFNGLYEVSENEIINNVKEFLQSSVSFNKSVSLNTNSYGDIKAISTTNNMGTIIVVENSVLYFIKFSQNDPSNMTRAKISLKENESIIEFSLKSNNELLLLIHSNAEYLLHTINLDSINPEENVQYDNIIKSKELIISELQNPAYLSINDTIGCIFDTTRKNYVVFNL